MPERPSGDGGPEEGAGETAAKEDGAERSPPRAAPTAQDLENARIRREIAERQEAEYVACLRLALGAFGPGWLPTCRHFLLDKDDEDRCRHSGERPTPAATVYTVKHADGRRRHFTLDEAGRVVEHASYEEGFGSMLLEPHPSRTIEVRGQTVHPHRYSLCWAPYELYTPKTAEQLAALRATRERRREEREEKKWAEEHPLFEAAGLTRKDL